MQAPPLPPDTLAFLLARNIISHTREAPPPARRLNGLDAFEVGLLLCIYRRGYVRGIRGTRGHESMARGHSPHGFSMSEK